MWTIKTSILIGVYHDHSTAIEISNIILVVTHVATLWEGNSLNMQTIHTAIKIRFEKLSSNGNIISLRQEQLPYTN